MTLEEALASARNSYDTGKYAHCKQLLERILATEPRQADALHLLGLLAIKAGQPSAGLALIEQALQIREDWSEAQCSRAHALAKCGRRDEAISHLAAWCVVHATDSDAWLALARHLQHVGRPDEARKAITAALTARPDWADAYTTLGNLELQAGQPALALSAYSAALTADPQSAEAAFGMGAALQAKGELVGAEECYIQAIARRSNYVEAWCNLGNTQRDLGYIEGALDSLNNAVALAPNAAVARYNLGWTQLLAGDFAAGWPNYAYRRDVMPASTAIPQHCPRWLGEPLAGKRLLLLKEQGFGDQIQFARYIPLLANLGVTLDVRISQPLRRLFERLPGIARLNPEDEGTNHDYWCSLLDLPGLFGTTLENIPVNVPYLRADKSATADWAGRLGAGIKVGMVWSGNPAHTNDRYRSMPIQALAPLAPMPNVQFVSLQKGPACADLAHAPFKLIDAGNALADFGDTAALINALDLLISVDTAVVHLAGALAKPVWTLLPANPDWRWMRDRSDSPWYPSMRLFRQHSLGDWTLAIDSVREALEAFVLARSAR